MNIKPRKSGVDLIGSCVMSDVALQTLYNLWSQTRAERLAPFRAEIETPRAGPLAAIVFQLEIQGDIAKIRHPGAVLNKIAGAEAHGRPLVSLMSPESRAQLVLVMKKVLETPAVAELVLNAQDDNGEVFSVNLLLMPLRSDFGVMDRMLCGVTSAAPPAATPLTLSIADVQIKTIAAARFDAQTMPGFSEPAAAFGAQDTPKFQQVSDNPAAQSGVSRGRFRVIKGGLDEG